MVVGKKVDGGNDDDDDDYKHLQYTSVTIFCQYSFILIKTTQSHMSQVKICNLG